MCRSVPACEPAGGGVPASGVRGRTPGPIRWSVGPPGARDQQVHRHPRTRYNRPRTALGVLRTAAPTAGLVTGTRGETPGPAETLPVTHSYVPLPGFRRLHSGRHLPPPCANLPEGPRPYRSGAGPIPRPGGSRLYGSGRHACAASPAHEPTSGASPVPHPEVLRPLGPRQAHSTQTFPRAGLLARTRADDQRGPTLLS